MDKIITLLQGLFNLTKLASITLPGIISAGALAYLLRPTLPEDFIPNFVPNTNYLPNSSKPNPYKGDEVANPVDINTKLNACRNFDMAKIRPAEVERAKKEYMRNCLPPTEPACTQKWDNEGMNHLPLKKTANTSFAERRENKTKNQATLEKAKQTVAYCINAEQNWQGIESVQNEMLKNDITFFQKELSAAQDNLLAQQKANGIFIEKYRSDVSRAQNEINLRRERLIYNEQSSNNRKASLGDLKRIDDLISARLSDPGRLRPLQPFDYYLSALVNHVVALSLLAIALGVILDPLSQGITTACFDAIFKRGF
jgi:hypothetical protein